MDHTTFLSTHYRTTRTVEVIPGLPKLPPFLGPGREGCVERHRDIALMREANISFINN